MEIAKELFEEAISLYSDVAKANIATQIALDLQEKMHLESFKKENSSKYVPAVLFSQELNLKVIASDERDPFLKKEGVLTKAEIAFNTFHVYDDTFCSFYLMLNLYSHENTLSFCVARTKDENNKYYMVSFLEKEFKLQKGNNSVIKFSSKEDMLLVLNFCNEAIIALNSKIENDYQLVPHFKVV